MSAYYCLTMDERSLRALPPDRLRELLRGAVGLLHVPPPPADDTVASVEAVLEHYVPPAIWAEAPARHGPLDLYVSREPPHVDHTRAVLYAPASGAWTRIGWQDERDPLRRPLPAERTPEFVSPRPRWSEGAVGVLPYLVAGGHVKAAHFDAFRAWLEEAWAAYRARSSAYELLDACVEAGLTPFESVDELVRCTL